MTDRTADTIHELYNSCPPTLFSLLSTLNFSQEAFLPNNPTNICGSRLLQILPLSLFFFFFLGPTTFTSFSSSLIFLLRFSPPPLPASFFALTSSFTAAAFLQLASYHSRLPLTTYAFSIANSTRRRLFLSPTSSSSLHSLTARTFNHVNALRHILMTIIF
jgi:hypothetical protein